MTRVASALLLAHLVQLSLASSPVFHRFNFGTANATVVSDGPVLFQENPFLVPDRDLRNAFAQLNRSINPVRLQQNILVIDIPKLGHFMVDTGSRTDQPSKFSPDSGALFDNLQAAGIRPESVNYILLTHGHLDHVSGLRALGGGRAFPNAHVYISRREHMFWTNPPMAPNATDVPSEALQFFAFFYSKAVESYKDRLQLVKRPRVLPGIRFIRGGGHSPGHCAIQIQIGKKFLIVSGDTWVSRPDQLRHPSWYFRYETNHAQAKRSRVRLLRRSVTKKALVLAYHEAFPGLGYINRKGHGYKESFDWVPVHA